LSGRHEPPLADGLERGLIEARRTAGRLELDPLCDAVDADQHAQHHSPLLAHAARERRVGGRRIAEVLGVEARRYDRRRRGRPNGVDGFYRGWRLRRRGSQRDRRFVECAARHDRRRRNDEFDRHRRVLRLDLGQLRLGRGRLVLVRDQADDDRRRGLQRAPDGPMLEKECDDEQVKRDRAGDAGDAAAAIRECGPARRRILERRKNASLASRVANERAAG
jgi:hypothetical protein